MEIKLTDLFSRIIACNSVSSVNPLLDQGNRQVIELLANILEKMGFDCEVMPVEQPGTPSARSYNKANLIATLGKGPGGLVLSGHTDTVPCDEKLWTNDPYTLTERDSRWYGLGTCDMKGFFPLVVEAVKPFLDKELKQPLIILATADEETSMSGARALVENGKPLARTAVIGEPTGMKPINMHKGIMVEKLAISGKSGHSSNPGFGVNAMETMHSILGQLIHLRDRLQQQKHPGFMIDHPTLNLGCISGGDNANRICGHCTLAFEIRPVPGMDLNQLQKDLESEIATTTAQDGVEWTLEKLIVPPFTSHEKSEIVSLCEKLTGHSSESVAFATEAPFLQQLGMDVVILGPGDIDQAHQPNEFLALERVQPTIDLLSQLIGRCCL